MLLSNSGTNTQSDANVGNELDLTIEKNGLDPHKSVTLDGVIWQETDDGLLVLNVTWQGKSYAGVLLDSSNDFLTPKHSNSPVDDSTPKLRTRRSQIGSSPMTGSSPIGSSPLGRETRKSLRISKAKDQNVSSPSKNLRPSNGHSPSKNGQKRQSSADQTGKKSRYETGRNYSENDENSESGQTTDGGSDRKEKRNGFSDQNSLSQSQPKKRNQGSKQNGEIKREGFETTLDDQTIQLNSNHYTAPSKDMTKQKCPTHLEYNLDQAGCEPSPNMQEQFGDEIDKNKDSKESSNSKVNEENLPLPPLSFTIVCPVEDCRKRYRHYKGLHYHISQAHPDMKFPQRENEENNSEEMDESSKNNVTNSDDESKCSEKRKIANEYVSKKLTDQPQKKKRKEEKQEIDCQNEIPETINKSMNNPNDDSKAGQQPESVNSSLPSIQKFSAENTTTQQDASYAFQQFKLGLQSGRFQGIESEHFPRIGPALQHSPQGNILPPRPMIPSNNFGVSHQGLDLSQHVQNKSPMPAHQREKESTDKNNAKCKNSSDRTVHTRNPQSENQSNFNQNRMGQSNNFQGNSNPNKSGGQMEQQPWGPPHLLHPAFFMQQGMMPPGLLPFGPNPYLMHQLAAAASGMRPNFHQNPPKPGEASNPQNVENVKALEMMQQHANHYNNDVKNGKPN